MIFFAEKLPKDLKFAPVKFHVIWSKSLASRNRDPFFFLTIIWVEITESHDLALLLVLYQWTQLW